MPVVPGVPGAALPPGDDAIIRRVQELERAQKEILPAIMAIVGPQIATLTSQQATLTAQQATLTTAVANISALVSQQVQGATAYAAANAVSIPIGTTAYAAASVVVPSGYTRATVVAISDAFLGRSSGVVLSIATSIAGVAGDGDTIAATDSFEAGSASYARDLSGLTVGSSITANTQVTSSVTGHTGNIRTVLMAFFLR